MSEYFDIAYSKNVIEFVAVASEYCSMAEQARKMKIFPFVNIAHKLLPLLYLKGAMLPDFESSFNEPVEKFVTEIEYEKIRTGILRILGQFDNYQEVFDPIRKDTEEPVSLSISEDLADVYQDVKDFLSLYHVGNDELMMEAVWECRQSFRDYWGQKIVNVLRALHQLNYMTENIEHMDIVNPEEDREQEGQGWLLSKEAEEDKDDE